MSLISRRHVLTTATGAAVAGLLGGSEMISVAAPKRTSPAMIGHRAPPIEEVRIGLIGLGNRGKGAIRRLMLIPGAKITAISDLDPTRLRQSERTISAWGNFPKIYFGGENAWKAMMQQDLDLVYICTPWDLHAAMALEAMKNGKHAAVEVPLATTMDDLWALIDMSEKTRRHCMLLENVCYMRTEMAVRRMCDAGLLGELSHGEAAYIHDLRAKKFSNHYHDGWRLKQSISRNGNLYPTHGLGPISQYMGIFRNDMMIKINSMSSEQRGLTEYAIRKFGKDSAEAKQTYALGDVNTSVIETAKGRTIMLQHKTSQPTPYSRLNQISGTKGIFAGYPNRIALEPDPDKWASETMLDGLLKEYGDPLWKTHGKKAQEIGGHGGADALMDMRLIENLRNGEKLDISVYESALWSAMGPLSEYSVSKDGATVEIPDFSRGAIKL